MFRFDPQLLLHNLARLPLLIIALSVHEWAHAFMAYRLGDNTARLQGRLTLNPLPHIDLIGTILVPIAVGFFGWAKPVPFTATALTRKLTMRTGVALVALAGPVSNLIQAFLGAIVFGVVAGVAFRMAGPGGVPWFEVLMDFAVGNPEKGTAGFIQINCALAIFNLIPVHPLDGGKIFYGILPRSAGDALIDNPFMARYGFMILFALMFVARPVMRVIMWPAVMLTEGLGWMSGMIIELIA